MTERGNDLPKSRTRRKADTTERARALRWVDNSAEGALWNELKRRGLGGHHFTRQFPIGPYFADFCCRKAKLVIEIDGSQHADSNYDRRRDQYMRSAGYSTLRFWNHDVLKHRTFVCETILAALDGRLAENIVASDLRFVFSPQTNLHSISELKSLSP
jgi:very-short-patch-repair endonuclease